MKPQTKGICATGVLIENGAAAAAANNKAAVDQPNDVKSSNVGQVINIIIIISLFCGT